MEMENKQQQIKESKEAMVNAELEANDIEMEKRRAEITEEVKDMLKEKGIEVLPVDYDAGAEMVAIVDQYFETIERINAEIKHNLERYSNSVAKEKNIHLNLDAKDELYEANKKLDDIVKKQEKIQQMKIENAQADPKYKEQKMESIQMLNMLKDVKDIPNEMLVDLISPMVNAQDVKTLEIAKVMLQGNKLASHTLTQTIDGINEALDNTELKQCIETMKTYLKTGEENFSVFSLKSKYQKK